MAIRIRLLATAAIPLIAFTGLAAPTFAAMPSQQLEMTARGPIVLAQSQDEEEIKRQKREAREKRKQERQNAQDAAGEEQPVRKNRKQAQQNEETAPNDAAADEQPVRKKRKQAQEDNAAAPETNDAAAEEQPKKRRKNQQVEETAPATNDAAADEQPVRKKRKQAEQTDEAAPAANDAAEETPVKKRKNNQQAEDANPATDNADGNEQPKKRKKDQAANEQNDPANADDTTKKRRKAETREDTRKKNEVAKDPSKSSETIELPVENGNAVLDSDKDAEKTADEKTRKRRQQQREEADRKPAPKSDKDAQKIDVNIVIKPVLQEKGERVTGFQGYENPRGKPVGDKDDVRIIFNLDGRVVIRDDDRSRLDRYGPIRYERLNDGRIREVVVRPNGDRVVTVRNRFGEIIRRSRIDNRDREVVIFYSPILERGERQLYLRDPGFDLPPMRLRIPVRDYIIDVSSDRNRNYREFLAQPPVEEVERVYSVDEVKYSARIRDKVRRIDLDTITFDTGSAEVSDDDAMSLEEVANAMNAILKRDPGETFLIEGHTDAVGADESNLVLSDERAESVASVLSDEFGVPAENLVTQGYGERFLKVDTDEAERMNRRVTIRRITSLVRPANAASNEE